MGGDRYQRRPVYQPCASGVGGKVSRFSLFFFFGCARNGLSAMTVSFAGIDRHVRKMCRESGQSDVDKSNQWPSGSIQLAALFSFCQTT